MLLTLRPPKSGASRLVPQPLGIALSATTPHWGGRPRESETSIPGCNNAEVSSFVCIIPPSRLPQSALPWLGSGSQFLTRLLCLSLCPLPSATLAFMVLAWGAHASPSVQSHMLPARTAKSRPVLGDSIPAPVAGLRPFLPNLVTRKQPGCHGRPGPPHGGSAAGLCLLAPGAPDEHLATFPWGQPLVGIQGLGSMQMSWTLPGWRVPPTVNLEVTQSGGTFRKN